MNQNNYLQHYGVLGMKWGVRRYQNADGSLTEAGKKRYLNSDGSLNNSGKKQVSKTYKKLTVETNKNFNKQATQMYVNAHNKAASDMNNGGIEKFNKEQQKKYGNDFAKRKGYEEDYLEVFDKKFQSYYNKSLSDFYDTDESFKKAKDLAEKYDMVSWNELAKQNTETINELERFVKANTK